MEQGVSPARSSVGQDAGPARPTPVITVSPDLRPVLRVGLVALDGVAVAEREPRLDAPLAEAEARTRIDPRRTSRRPRDVPARRARPDEAPAVLRSAPPPRPQGRATAAHQQPRGRVQLVLPRVPAAVRPLRPCAGRAVRIDLRFGHDGESYPGIRKDDVHVGGRIALADGAGGVRQPDVRLGADDGDRGHHAGAARRLRPVRASPRIALAARRRGDLGAARQFCGGAEITPASYERERDHTISIGRGSSAIIAAGGQGRRLGTAVPKQLLELGGPHHPRTQRPGVLSHPRSPKSSWRCRGGRGRPAAVTPRRATSRVRVVEGGARRQDSVANAFARHRRRTSTSSSSTTRRGRSSTRRRSIGPSRPPLEAGAAIAALPARDTVKLAAPSRRWQPAGHRTRHASTARRDLARADAAGLPPRRARRAIARGQQGAAHRRGRARRAGRPRGAARRGRPAEPEDHDRRRSRPRARSWLAPEQGDRE